MTATHWWRCLLGAYRPWYRPDEAIKAFETQLPGLVILKQPNGIQDDFDDDSTYLDINYASEILLQEATGDEAPSTDGPEDLT